MKRSIVSRYSTCGSHRANRLSSAEIMDGSIASHCSSQILPTVSIRQILVTLQIMRCEGWIHNHWANVSDGFIAESKFCADGFEVRSPSSTVHCTAEVHSTEWGWSRHEQVADHQIL